jgi:glycosyltransferase involved in cell wall biosynthesis
MKEASRYLKAFDLFVLPSVFEGMSLSLMEAKAAGVSALASRVGGNEEIVGQENCFALDDMAGFIKKIENINKLFGENNFSSQDMCRQYIKIYGLL